MLFSTVAFPEYIEDVENKLRLNLSDYACYILNADIEGFGHGSRKKDRIESAVINRIFHCYKDTASSSVSLIIESKREELKSILIGFTDINGVVERLLAVYEEQLLMNVKDLLKDRGNAFSVRLNTDILEYLRSDEGQSERGYYNDRVGLYVKAVIEEYCRQSYSIRERIFYSGNCNAISSAIENSAMVKLKLYSKHGNQNNILYMKPICIAEDNEHRYNYAAGMISCNRGGPWAVGSVRLSSIETAECQKKSGYLSHDEITFIKKEIQKKGIQYLSAEGSTERIIVLFTQEGERMYRKILHLRPQYIHKDGLTYEFDCTVRHASNYFFKFGHNAKIISPSHLAESFGRKYKNAAKQYEQ